MSGFMDSAITALEKARETADNERLPAEAKAREIGLWQAQAQTCALLALVEELREVRKAVIDVGSWIASGDRV